MNFTLDERREKVLLTGAWKNKTRTPLVVPCGRDFAREAGFSPGEGNKVPHTLEAKRSEREERKNKTQANQQVWSKGDRVDYGSRSQTY